MNAPADPRQLEHRIPLDGEGAIDPARQRQVVDRLRAVLPDHHVLYREEDTRAYECDGLTLYTQLPMVVALAESEAQVVAVVKICRELGVPIVPRGAGTGLSGGCTPHKAGVLLSTAKMNRIVKLDALARTAVVQPGVRNLAISEAAAAFGLYYAPDPSSQIACSIGGNVAENSGGVHCLKYGLTVHNVLRVRAVTIDGEVVEFGSHALDAPGLDLLALAIGSEGLLAVTTEVTVKLVPKPQLARCVMASFADVGVAGEAVAAIIAAGIIPAGLEMMDQPATKMVEPFVKAGYDLDAVAILLVESDGTPDEVEDEIARLSEVLRGAGATRIAVSASEAERLRFWAGRKNAFPAAGRVSPAYYCMDGTIPRKRLGEMLRAIQKLEAKYGLSCPNVFHAGDGNLHPLILFDDSNPDSVRRAEDMGVEILEMSVALGGTITGEHGVGVEKISQMCSQFSDAERAMFHAIKRAFDPSGLLNPDKAIPTLHRCAEYGRMKVAGGKLPHAQLERFCAWRPTSHRCKSGSPLRPRRARACASAPAAARISTVNRAAMVICSIHAVMALAPPTMASLPTSRPNSW
jgi:glycolate oxidase